MMNNLLLFLTLLLSQTIFGKSNISLNFQLEGNVKKSINFSFFFLHDNIVVETGFQYVNLNNLNTNKSLIFNIDNLDKYDTLKGVFTYETAEGVFEEEMIFLADFPRLERTEIHLIYTANHSELEFLKEFSVNYFSHNQELQILTNFEKNINSTPNFILKNPTNTKFWNYKDFNGEMSINTNAIGWITFQGPHLPWFKFSGPISKGEMIYSSCEDFYENNQILPAFKLVKTEGYEYYQFRIYVTKENYANESDEIKLLGAKTFKKIRNIYIISKDFKAF